MKIYPIWNYLFAVHKQSRRYLQYICVSYTESYSNLIRVGPAYVKYTHYTIIKYIYTDLKLYLVYDLTIRLLKETVAFDFIAL